jgi:hypothetical protein
MRMAILLAPVHPTHPNLCDYGNALFFFVPGDTGNPFVAIWQADLVQSAVLLVAGFIVLWLTRRQQQGITRFFGWIYVAAAAASALLAGVAYFTSTPLVCHGAPGSGSPSSREQQAYQTFQTVHTLSTLMLYLTLLLLVALVIFLIVVGARAGWRRVRGNEPAGA